MDLETVLSKNAFLNGQLESAKSVIDTQNKDINKLNTELNLFKNKLHEAELDTAQVRKIMVDNITQSNVTLQQNLGEIQELKGIVAQHKAKDKE